jgi:hypothetical protein
LQVRKFFPQDLLRRETRIAAPPDQALIADIPVGDRSSRVRLAIDNVCIIFLHKIEKWPLSGVTA